MTVPQPSSPRRRLVARVVALASVLAVPGPFVTAAGAVGPVNPGAGVHVAQLADLSVSQAQDEVAASHAHRAEAEERLAQLQQAADTTRAQLAQLGEQRQDVLNRLSDLQQQAQRLAVDAYVRGAGTDELAAVLDTNEATDAAWRRHLTVGRVDQASEAAFKLRDLREQVDSQLAQLADQATSAEQAVRDAEEDVRQAIAGEAHAEQQLVDARAAEERAAAARAAEERAAAARAAQERAAAAAGAAQASGQASGQPEAAATETPAVRVVSLGDPWAYLRDCESGGNYRAVSANGLYRGAYQFDVATWEAIGGRGDPAAASPSEQDARAYALYQQRGSAPWPTCGRYLP